MDARKREEDPEGADFISSRVPRKWRTLMMWVMAIATGIATCVGTYTKMMADKEMPTQIEGLVAKQVSVQIAEIRKDLDDQSAQLAEINQAILEIARRQKTDTKAEIRHQVVLDALANIASEIQTKLKRR